MDKIVKTAPREALLTRTYIDDLAASVSRVALSRRLLVEAATDVLYDWIECGGSIVSAEGGPIVLYPGVFDDVHSPNSDGEWISDLRRRSLKGPRRAPRKTLLGRLQLYDGLFRIAGCPVGNEARRTEVAETRKLLRSFTAVTRARYVHEVRKLRLTYRGRAPLHYGAAVKRLRVRFAQELEAWRSQN